MRIVTFGAAALLTANILCCRESYAAALPPNAQIIVGTYDCIVSSGGRRIDRFQSVNTAWRTWLQVTTTSASTAGKPPDVAHVFVGFDPEAKRWNIVGVDSSGSYWTRHSTSKAFDGSRWIDDYPADGGTAVVRVLKSGAEYTFDLSLPKGNGASDSSRVVCMRR